MSWRQNVFAVANQKGGTGKTTVSVNLAVCLAELHDKKVLIIDMDAQSHSTIHLGFKPHELERTVANILFDGEKMENVIMKTNVKNLFIAPSNINLAGTDLKLADVIGRETLLREAVKNIKNDFDFIFMDCPPSLGLLTVNSLTAADWVLIPVQTQFFALEGLSKLLNTIQVIRERLNPSLEIFGIIANMFDSRRKICHDVVNSLKERFGDKLFSTMIRDTVRIVEAPSFGVSVLHHDPRSSGAEDFKLLADEFLRRLG